MAAETETQPQEALTLLARLERFERFRSGEAPAISSPLTTDPDAHVDTILPDGWRDELAPPRKRRRRRRTARPWVRRARWYVVLLALAGGAAAAAVLILVPGYAESVADDRAADYRAALVELDESLADVPAVLEALGDIDVAGEELATEVRPFGRFRAATVAMSATARERLPELPPLFPDDAVADLAPLRERLALVAGRGDVLAGRIENVVDYRSEVEKAFVLPQLPLAVESSEINDVSLALAQMLADSLEAVSSLPSEPFLDQHRESVQESLEWFRSWEIDYLEALRSGSPTAASALANQARSRLGRLRIGLEGPLLEFSAWARTELVGLDGDVGAALVVVPSAS